MTASDRDDRRRTTLLDAALDSFLRFGYEKVSMSDIAAAAGLSRQTVYRALGDKEQVFLAVAERFHTDTTEAIRRAAETTGRLDERLAAMAVAKLSPHIDIATGSPHGVELLGVNHRLGAALSQRTDDTFEMLIASLVEIDRATSQVGPGAASPTEVAEMVHALVDGMEQRILDGRTPRWTETWRDELTTWIGIAVRGARRPGDSPAVP